MPSAYETAATALKAIIDSEFTAEGYTAIHDKLHPSVGSERTEIGLSPLRQLPVANNNSVLDTTIYVQFYDRWDKEVDNHQQVNPLRITDYADRFMRAVESQQATAAGSNEVWYFMLTSIDYPDDPTGNKTRFEAVVLAKGDNIALTQRL